MNLSGRVVQILAAAAAAALLAAFFFASRGQVCSYREQGRLSLNRASGYTASIPNTIEGLNAGFSLPHQNRAGESFWLHLSLSFNPEPPREGAVSLQIIRLSIRDEQGNPVRLEGRRSSNPEFARAVHYEEGALVGLRAFSFDRFFVAGIPFELSPPPKQLFLAYEFLVKTADGNEETVSGTLKLEREFARRFLFNPQDSK